MKNKLHFIAIMVIAIILSSLTITANAASPFSDVSEETQYYDSIMALANEGIISGFEDGTFKPNKNILVREALTIIEKTFGNKENLPEWEKWEELTRIGHVYKTDWDLNPTLFFNDYLGAVTYELAGHFIIESSRSEFLAPYAFNLSSNFEYFDNLQVRGFHTENQPYKMMTRAEFCDVVVWAKQNIYTLPELNANIPDIISYSGYEDELEKFSEDTRVVTSILRTPEWLLNYYSSSNGTIKIVHSDNWSKFCDDNLAIGFYEHSYNNPKIYIRSVTPSVLLHELGHFIYFEKNISFPTDIYNKDIDAMKKITFSEYCETSKAEYFAEAFQAYILNKDKVELYTPDTFEFIDNICKNLEEKYK